MGESLSDLPGPEAPAERLLRSEYRYPPLVGPSRRRDPMTRYVLLFLLTVASTTLVGAGHYGSFYLGFTNADIPFSTAGLLVRGLWYSVPILLILGTHELGHYFACKYYGVEASRPYFLPMPFVLTGTLGAFIRIRQPIPNKRQLFDIGIAGPIAGFVVAVPVLFLGMYLSTAVQIPSDFEGSLFWIGEPLLFKAAAWLTFGSLPEGWTVNMHPVSFAAWFGLLATALNLFPIGQLDGGHISYAVLGRKSTAVTLVMVVCLIGLAFWSLSWAVWAGLMVVMLLAFGPRHPRTPDEDEPLDPTRKWLALFAVVMFVLCFTPAPIEPMDIVTAP
jgi:membrane-associated protease RseP (regulator of RpoE activity)